MHWLKMARATGNRGLLVAGIAAAGGMAPMGAQANEIGWKCGYITKPAANYTYRQAKVKGFPDRIDCEKRFRKQYPSLVIAQGFSGNLSDQEIRSKVAKSANAAGK